MKQLFREPLVHFLLLGVGLFVAFGLVGKRTSGESGKIVITQGQSSTSQPATIASMDGRLCRKSWKA
jgi:hypothetical protein